MGNEVVIFSNDIDLGQVLRDIVEESGVDSKTATPQTLYPTSRREAALAAASYIDKDTRAIIWDVRAGGAKDENEAVENLQSALLTPGILGTRRLILLTDRSESTHGELLSMLRNLLPQEPADKQVKIIKSPFDIDLVINALSEAVGSPSTAPITARRTPPLGSGQ